MTIPLLPLMTILYFQTLSRLLHPLMLLKTPLVLVQSVRLPIQQFFRRMLKDFKIALTNYPVYQYVYRIPKVQITSTQLDNLQVRWFDCEVFLMS